MNARRSHRGPGIRCRAAVRTAFHAGWLAALLSSPVFAAEPPRALAVADVTHSGPVDFEKEILPILRSNCLACHKGAEQGDFDDDRAAISQ